MSRWDSRWSSQPTSESKQRRWRAPPNPSGTLRPSVRRQEVRARSHPMEANEANDPVHVGPLGMNGIVVETEHVTDFIKQFWLLTSCCD